MHHVARAVIVAAAVFLPAVAQAQSLTGSRYDYIMGEQIKSKPPTVFPLPDMQAPQVPPP